MSLNKIKGYSLVLIMLVLAITALVISGCEVKTTSTEESEAVKYERPDVVESGDEALKLLKEGNERFANDALASKDIGSDRRKELTAGQKPFAIILSCSDSRVPPEEVFDQGLGDLFVIRVAGNVDDTVTLGSIEYAAEHLHVPLLVVMGHSSCGAVKATVEGGEVPPNIGAIAAKISPSVEIAKKESQEEEEVIEAAVVENVKATIKSIEANSSIVEELAEKKELKVVGAKYDLETGMVEFLEE